MNSWPKIDEMKKRQNGSFQRPGPNHSHNELSGDRGAFFLHRGKDRKKEYYDFLYEVREMRKELLKKIVGEPEGEIWCISKHLLAASYRLMEVGTKQLTLQKKKRLMSFLKNRLSAIPCSGV